MKVLIAVAVGFALAQQQISDADEDAVSKVEKYEYPSWSDQVAHLTGWDYGRIGALVVIALLMSFNYLMPLFGQPELLLDVSRDAIGDPDVDIKQLWKDTHAHGKIGCLEASMLWVQLLAMGTLGMVAFQPNCNQTLCKILMFVFISWQPVWYFGLLGRVDDEKGLKRDAMYIFKKETGQEIFLSIIMLWLGFLSPAPYGPSMQEQWSHMGTWDYVRIGFQCVIALVMGVNYLIPIWGDHSLIVSKSRMMIANEEEDAAEVWKGLHSNVKIMCIEMAMLWVQLMIIMNLGTLAFQPSTSKTFCKMLCIYFLSWQPVWYFVVMGKVDNMDVFKRDAMFIFKNESIMEITLCLIFVPLGFILP